MHIRRKVGRFRAVIAAVVLGIGMLAAVPASTQPAVAREAQPAPVEAGCAPAFPNVVPNWQQTFSQRGVTLCQGNGADGDPDAYVQIIDLTAGAKLRFVSEHCPNLPECPFGTGPQFTNVKFYRRTAPDWFTWTRNNVSNPSSARLFSTTNASFFIGEPLSTEPTQLSFPYLHNLDNPPGGSPQFMWTFGYVLDHQDDLGYKNGPKKIIRFGDANAAKQSVQIADFPTEYVSNDVVNAIFGLDRERGDETVGYATQQGEDTTRRTFVGTDLAQNTAYILNTGEHFNNSDTANILASFGAGTQIQLDGGGSTQLAVDANLDGIPGTALESDDFPSPRTVPNALAVYLGP